jgi:hypothetical protein
VVVRVHKRVVALPPAENLDRAVRQHLVDIHMERSARALMEDVGRELVAQVALQNFVGGLNDGTPDVFRQQPQLYVRLRRRLFEQYIRLNHQGRLSNTADGEVLLRPQGLQTPVDIGGQFAFA